MSGMPTIMVAQRIRMRRPLTPFSIMEPAVSPTPTMTTGGNVLTDHATSEWSVGIHPAWCAATKRQTREV
jgi:hypothetical protein